MKKDEIIKGLEELFDDEATIHQFDLTLAPLLEKERESLRSYETNWQSYVLSSLIKLLTTNEQTHLICHWAVNRLEQSDEAFNYFCNNPDWVEMEKKWCQTDGKCWEQESTEFDAVLKDSNGNWLAIFEYEDDYNSCCQELCNMLKLTRWLKTQQSFAPLFCLFYWLPIKPKEKYMESKANLKEYIKFINKYLYEFRGTRFVIVLQSGPDDPPYAITKTKVVSDKNNFNDVNRILKELDKIV
jgi:hypothetical protein